MNVALKILFKFDRTLSSPNELKLMLDYFQMKTQTSMPL